MEHTSSHTTNNIIECNAAVAIQPAEPLSFIKILVHPPKTGEVRLKILFTSICHTDEFTLSGKDPEGNFPCILGHEACAVVESVGKNVTTCKVGDIVIPFYMPECFEEDREKNSCSTCRGYECNLTNICGKLRNFTSKGVMKSDGQTRFFFPDGKPIFHYCGVSTFSEYTVCHQESIVVINPKAPVDRIGLLGCGISTGFGAVWNTAQVKPDSSVAVFGLGSVGLAVIQACAISKARQIFAIDLNEEKFEKARFFGASQCINSKKLPDQFKSIQEYIINLTNGGVDYSFECIGNVDVMRSALECSAKGWGVSVIIGVADGGKEICTRPFQLITGRTWKGTSVGGWKPRSQLPKLVDMYLEKKYDLDSYITERLSFENINDAFNSLRQGKTLKSMLKVASEVED